MFTATFDEAILVLYPKKQTLRADNDARKTLQFWWSALSTREIPHRRMLRCSGYTFQTLDILKFKSDPVTTDTLWMSVPSCAWKRREKLQTKPRLQHPASKMEIWLEAQQEGLEVMDVETATEAVVLWS